jgi:peptidoglycan/LPS O-acetylase OafA/YrhL
MAPTRSLTALTSIRFLAALRVAIYHLVHWDSTGYWWRGLMATPASVCYFFVSSGFLLTYTYARRFDGGEIPYRKFWLGRAVRLLPVYYLGLFLAFPLLFHNHAFSFAKFLATIFLLQSWFPASALYWVYPAWALSNLAFCYFCLPFLLRATRSVSLSALLAYGTLAWLTSLTISFTYLHLNPDGLASINSTSGGFWLYVLKFNPLIHIPEFLIGVLAGRFFLSGRRFTEGQADRTFVASAAAILVVLLLGNIIPYPSTHTGLLAPLLAIFILSLASGGFAARALQPKVFVLLGQSSFALYILHAPLWDYLHWFVGVSVVTNHGFKLVALAGIVALSLALYKWIEVPVTSALRLRLVGPGGSASKTAE